MMTATDFEQAIIRHIPKLTRAAVMFCRGNHADAADVVQDSFIRAMRTRANFTPGTDMGLWLRCIVRSEASHTLRRYRMHADVDDLAEVVPCSADVLASVQARQGLRAILDLEPRVRDLIINGAPRGVTSSRHVRAKATAKRERMQGLYI